MFPHVLVPVSETKYKSGFTTCTSLRHQKIDVVELNDKGLGVHKVTSNTKHNLVKPPLPKGVPLDSDETEENGLPPPQIAWEAFYPKGSINPSAPIPGGFGFYASGPPEFARSLKNGASEVIMSYRMMLQDRWEWVKGGKLPGVFGGVGDLSYGCSGGRQDERCKCFGLRAMWRAKSAGEMYAYLPMTENNRHRLLAVPPVSTENGDYGISVGRGSFHLDKAVGRWVSVAFRIKLNDVGKENGEVQLWVDGISVILAKGLTLRASDESKIRGLHFQTFFGGHKPDWASPKDQRAWFADVTGVILN